MAKLIKIWAVNQGDDDRNCGTPTWFFEDETMARHVAKGRGWWGGIAPVGQHDAVKLEDGTVYLLKKATPLKMNIGPDDIKAMKKKALDKLDPVERELLGLKDFKL